MEKFDTVLARITEALANLAAQHGADAILLAGSVLQFKAIALLVIGITAISIASLFLKWGFAYANTAIDRYDIGPAKTVMSIGWVIFTISVGVATVLNPMNWVSVISPQHAIAAKIIGML